MIRRRPTGYIRRPYDYSNGDTEDTEFIRCVDGRDPQLHEMWCLSLDNVIRKIYPTAQIEVGAGTVGELTTNYLAENGRRILIIGQISINISVQFLGIPNFFSNSRLLFCENLQDPTVLIGWGHIDTTNHNCRVMSGGP